VTFFGDAPRPARSSSATTGLALLAGLGAAIAGAFVWGLVTYLTKHQFSLIAVLVGIVVGNTVGRFRPGNVAAAAASAVLALLGCALGTFLALVFAALGAGVGLATILSHLNVILHVYPGSVGALGLLFWLIAAFLAFRAALRRPMGRPAGGRPRRGGAAGYGTMGPASGQPTSGQPTFGQPTFGQPTFGQPTFGQPEPGHYESAEHPSAQPGSADGPGFALPQDPPHDPPR
jgi:hypothetical protein